MMNVPVTLITNWLNIQPMFLIVAFVVVIVFGLPLPAARTDKRLNWRKPTTVNGYCDSGPSFDSLWILIARSAIYCLNFVWVVFSPVLCVLRDLIFMGLSIFLKSRFPSFGMGSLPIGLDFPLTQQIVFRPLPNSSNHLAFVGFVPFLVISFHLLFIGFLITTRSLVDFLRVGVVIGSVRRNVTLLAVRAKPIFVPFVGVKFTDRLVLFAFTASLIHSITRIKNPLASCRLFCSGKAEANGRLNCNMQTTRAFPEQFNCSTSELTS